MKILIAPNAFKHSLTQAQAAEAIARGLSRSGLQAELVLIPLADGGNGTLDAFLARGGRRVEVDTFDALGRPCRAPIGLVADGKTAVIEMALASGLEQIANHELQPLRASTYGTGMLMRTAVELGCERLIIGLGGSATTDGGAGCMQALGVRLLDKRGKEMPPGGAALAQLDHIDLSKLDVRWRHTEVIIASDVDNPALGARGAAAVYAPQKGASPQEVAILETGLQQFFEVIYEQMGIDVRTAPGGGAAGAFAAGLMAFLGGKVQSGVDLVLDYHQFEELLKDASLVVTGEGRVDVQTLSGKGPVGLARRAAKHHTPTVLIVGSLEIDDSKLRDVGIVAALPIAPSPMTLEEAISHAGMLVEQAGLRLGYLLRLGIAMQSKTAE